jgi:hypothetical protein
MTEAGAGERTRREAATDDLRAGGVTVLRSNAVALEGARLRAADEVARAAICPELAARPYRERPGSGPRP